MPLQDIYILPSTFPLFDWADWPASKAALVSGGHTINFEKEAWNAIVDKLASALASAGIAWDAGITTAAQAQITESPGALTAEAFNSVRFNIDSPMPLGWAWAKDPTFRGYVGRENFRGSSVYGAACDSLYPEYIEELARKLNLLIGVMRGDMALPIVSSSGAETLAYASAELVAKSIKSLPTGGAEISRSLYVQQGIDLRPSAPIFPAETDELSTSRFSAKLPALRSGVIKPETRIEKSGYFIHPMRRVRALVQPVDEISASLVYFGWELATADYISGEGKAESSTETSVEALLTLALHGEDITRSVSADAGIILKPPLPAAGEGHAVSLSGTEPVKAGQTRAIKSKSRALSREQLISTPLPSAPASSAERSASQSAFSLDTAWWPPEWQPDGGLWIRQSHAVTIAEDGGLEVT